MLHVCNRSCKDKTTVFHFDTRVLIRQGYFPYFCLCQYRTGYEGAVEKQEQ